MLLARVEAESVDVLLEDTRPTEQGSAALVGACGAAGGGALLGVETEQVGNAVAVDVGHLKHSKII